jgi:hypothetical protein
MCIDFNPRDQTLYLVGTEEGSLHKCSVSYNEQYLDTYAGPDPRPPQTPAPNPPKAGGPRAGCARRITREARVAGHSGPVYKVAWSPFLPSAFLSCSADWSVKLWHADADAPLLSMQSSSDYVADIQWSPTVPPPPRYCCPYRVPIVHSLPPSLLLPIPMSLLYTPRSPTVPRSPREAAPRAPPRPDAPPLRAQVSTVFAAVTGDGDVNIWDMSVSTLDPVFKASLAPLGPEAGHSAPGRPSAVRFAPNADVLVPPPPPSSY